VLWHADGTREALAFGGDPSDLSADGSVVVGTTYVGGSIGYQAWRWTRPDGVQILGPWPYPIVRSHATAVSGDGQVVVGHFSQPNGGPIPFVWTPAGIATLPVPGGEPYGISADARVVVGGPWQAFRLDRETGTLEILDSVPWATSRAVAASPDGSASVGTIQTDMATSLGGDLQAFRWNSAGDLDGLGFLDDHWRTRQSWAEAASGDGSIVVGSALIGSENAVAAFVWDRIHGMRNLRDELEARFGLAVPWPLEWAFDGSADGRTIVGWSETRGRGWRVVLPPECDDGIDDDGDGRVDLADDGCSDADDLSETFATSACDDGRDTDGDGAVDSPADPGCSSSSDATETTFHSHCDDAQDNDRDGLADRNDPGCEGPSDPSERSPGSACDDGIDNDGDGLIDVHPEGALLGAEPGDPACFDPAWPREDAKCQDGIDNDGDGGIDVYGGPNDEPPDSVCVGAPWRDREAPAACGLGFELVGLAALATAGRRRPRSR
jgi:uncharacterized membrane protein